MVLYYALLESAVGYGLFEVNEAEEIGSTVESVRNACDDLNLFSRGVKLKAFHPFASTEDSLKDALMISEGEITETLLAFLQQSLPKIPENDKNRFLGVSDQKLGSSIAEALKVPVRWNDVVLETLRGCRVHLPHFTKSLTAADLIKASQALAHSYSRSRVKFNVHRQDNMIIQAIQLLDQLDKDLNTNVMRCREWYSWHFPELAKTVPDSYIYAKLVSCIQDRASLVTEPEDKVMEKLNAVTLDEEMSKQVLFAARNSMGMDVSPIDMLNVTMFASRVEALTKYRHELHNYLTSKMDVVSPNLSALLGETVGARLIAHAGSLTKLSKCPASTIQILGAEKALFRALKSKGNTPKFGLLFNSTYISRAATKNKGRISRYVANKCAIASRIDAFSDIPTREYGDSLRQQVEDRLKFYETGETPPKNLDVMLKVQESLKRKAQDDAGDEDEDEAAKKARKAAKKAAKKARLSAAAPQEEEEQAAMEVEDTKQEKKKKKKKSKHAEGDEE